MPEEMIAVEPEYAAYVALDWADREHAWALELPGGKKESGKLSQTPEAIDAWAAELARRFGGRPVAVALEQSRGALFYALQKYSHLVLYSIHPSTSADYRKAMFPAGRKSDPVDADLQLELLVRHRNRLRRLQLDDSRTRKLQLLTEKRRQLVDQQTAQTNRLTDLLKIYFPQALEWLRPLGTPMSIAFLQRWPTLPQLKKEDPEVVRRFFYQSGSRSHKRIDSRLAEIQQARPAIEDEAIIDPCVLMTQALLNLIAALGEGIANLQRACEQAFAAHPDAVIFNSFPGAGPVLAPRLLAAFGSQRNRWNSVQEMQPYTGIPPITVSSGNSERIHFRWKCPKFLRQTFHEHAGCSIQHSQWARAFYDHQRQVKNLDHDAAVRSLAYKWQRILFRCWKDRTPYQESYYQERLLQRHSAPPPPSIPPGTTTPKSTHRIQGCADGSNPVHFQFKKVAGFSKLSDATS